MKKIKKRIKIQHIVAISSVCAAVIALNACGSASTISTTAIVDSVPSNVETDITLNGDTATSTSDNVTVSGSTITITSGGTYKLSGTLDDGMVIIDADEEDVTLLLSNADITSSTSAAIYVKKAGSATVYTEEGTSNTLINKNGYTAIDDNNIDAVIFSKSDLILAGGGILKIQAETDGHGVVSKDNLTIGSGTYEISATKHGFAGKDSLTVTGGSFNVSCGLDAFHSNGDMNINGGNYEIAAEDDGMHADNELHVTDGSINITNSYEGLEGLKVDISGGTINIVSSDDGINAAEGSSEDESFAGSLSDKEPTTANYNCTVTISGGTINVNAGGDGIDSNGNLYISGGTTVISTPDNNGNGAIDYDGESSITGGTIIATGSSEMAMNFGSESTQGTILVNTGSLSAGDKVTLYDSSGNELLSATPSNSYSSVVVSCPSLNLNSTYTLSAGSSYSSTIELSTLVYGQSNGMGGGNMNNKGPGGMATPPNQR